MKLIIAGATGFCGSEVVKQSLRNPKITSVVTLSRKPVEAPEGPDASKLKSVIIEDYGSYSEEVKSHFADAGACIWYGWQSSYASPSHCALGEEQLTIDIQDCRHHTHKVQNVQMG